ncbi:MAG: hypothetical protein GXP36_03920 [Actinobacteria bacterium]|nr:hypothetical protein [Actinomycetota bacterium]
MGAGKKENLGTKLQNRLTRDRARKEKIGGYELQNRLTRNLPVRQGRRGAVRKGWYEAVPRHNDVDDGPHHATVPGTHPEEPLEIAVNLVETYLRLTGYFTLSEFEVQRREQDGSYTTVTDIDIMGIRMPGATVVGDPHGVGADVIVLDDPILALDSGVVDVIIGEVKQGEAVLNPGIKDHGVLHSMLRRVEWLYADPLPRVVTGLQRNMVHESAARGGGSIRTRIVAFGRAERSTVNVIDTVHIVETIAGFFEEYEAAFRPLRFSEPAPAFLNLLHKMGYTLSSPPEE